MAAAEDCRSASGSSAPRPATPRPAASRPHLIRPRGRRRARRCRPSMRVRQAPGDVREQALRGGVLGQHRGGEAPRRRGRARASASASPSARAQALALEAVADDDGHLGARRGSLARRAPSARRRPSRPGRRPGRRRARSGRRGRPRSGSAARPAVRRVLGARKRSRALRGESAAIPRTSRALSSGADGPDEDSRAVAQANIHAADGTRRRRRGRRCDACVTARAASRLCRV